MVRSLTRRARQGEHGYVLVLMALTLTVLILLVGFAVDLGSWYLRAAKLQRAADVAALSAAVELPDTAAAISEGNSSFVRNGVIQNQDVSYSVEAEEGRIVTQVQDSKVPTYFLNMLFPSIEISRSSAAVKRSSVPLGNPFNIFGYGRFTSFTSPPNMNVTGIDSQNFWAATNGTCMPKEDGDFNLAKFEGNYNPGTDRHVCSGALEQNPDYEPYGKNGYSYIIEIPGGVTQPVDIKLWDPGYAPAQYGGLAEDQYVRGGGVEPVFALYEITDEDANPDGNLVTTGLKQRDSEHPNGVNPWRLKTGDGPGRDNPANDLWETFATVQPSADGSPRMFRLQATTDDPINGVTNVGVNTFSVMAAVGPGQRACDSRVAPNTCPKVYGRGAVSVFNNVTAGESEFYLAEIDTTLTSSNITAYLWDPGEGAESIEILTPSGDPVDFTCQVSGTPAVPCNVNDKKLDVSGEGPQPGNNRKGKDRFNDRLVTIQFQVPSNYADDFVGPNGDYWWKLRYTAGSDVTDRITWGVDVGTASPVRLAKGP
jgi:hypothetical protein